MLIQILYSYIRGSLVINCLFRFRYDTGIRSIYPNPTGTRAVIVDETNAAFLYSPVNDQIVPITGYSGMFVYVTICAVMTFR